MVGHDWGLAETEGRFIRRTSAHDEIVDSDDLMDVPEVRAARIDGFEPAPEAPLWCFLPAVWPADARTWVRDTRVRHMSDGRTYLPWSAAVYYEMEGETNALLQKCGFGARPPGRIWLLRPPPGIHRLDKVLDGVSTSASTARLEVTASADFASHVRSEIQRLFGLPG